MVTQPPKTEDPSIGRAPGGDSRHPKRRYARRLTRPTLPIPRWVNRAGEATRIPRAAGERHRSAPPPAPPGVSAACARPGQ